MRIRPQRSQAQQQLAPAQMGSAALYAGSESSATLAERHWRQFWRPVQQQKAGTLTLLLPRPQVTVTCQLCQMTLLVLIRAQAGGGRDQLSRVVLRVHLQQQQQQQAGVERQLCWTRALLVMQQGLLLSGRAYRTLVAAAWRQRSTCRSSRGGASQALAFQRPCKPLQAATSSSRTCLMSI
jgi:hypothetical protein